MSITQRNYLWQTTLLTLLIGVATAVLYYHFSPHHYFRTYPVIPVFFWLGGVFTVRLVELCRRHAPRYLQQVYLLIRMVRMLLSLVVMVVCCMASHTDVRAFVMTFIANYFIYLIHDSWFFFTFELNRKKKRI